MSDIETKEVATDTTDAALLAHAKATISNTKEVEVPSAEASKQETETTEKTVTEEAKTEAKAETSVYQLKLPEGSLLKAEQLEKISTFAKEKGLSEADAQILVERESAVVSEFQAEQTEQFENAKTRWIEEVKADKELGGVEFDKNVGFAKKALDRFATEDLKKHLNDSGFGNHPELVRVFARIGKAMASDQMVRGSEAPARRTTEELLYGGSKK